jgi:hypothetical protein
MLDNLGLPTARSYWSLAVHTDHPPTSKRAIAIAVIIVVALFGLIGWMGYFSYTMVANAVLGRPS